jgi:soluble lytic murein transglycosylase-like protein
LGQTGSFDNTSGMAATQASAAGLPASLVERVIRRESGGNSRAVHGGNYGLMQIRLGTARAMGYTGSAAGLLDPQTNMTYGLRYLAGAYRAAGGNENRAIALYSRGYYYQAKAQGLSPYAL